jgi:GDP/UDP-N,N'-diacetylbacillosamine 2-epimerase (hydrolysing)
MKKRKIVALTGARSEYDLLYSVYQRLQADERFDFGLIVSGSHLSESFGYTARLIEQDGFAVHDKIYNLIDSNQRLGRAISLGHQIPALAQSFDRLQPDLVLVAGDREEALSATLTAAFMNLPVAHFFGGDIAKDGNIDNAVRYAASKFAHLHFTTLEAHRQNLLKLGEDDWRIHVVGNPALDRFLEAPLLPRAEVMHRLGVADTAQPYGVLIYHPIITQLEAQEQHVATVLEALQQTGLRFFVNYPNSDPGNYAIRQAYDALAAQYPGQFTVFQNLDRLLYINLLRHAACLFGNSSSGLLEAPSLGLPAINIGPRQRGRVHGANVLFVETEKGAILEAWQRVQTDEEFRRKLALKQNPYGDGKSAEKIVERLAGIPLNADLIYKNITY